jgi:hypothetical protein
MRKITRKGLKKKCDKMFSLLIRSKGYCELRGKDGISCGGVLQCAHIYTRGKHAIRWNPLNAVCLCAGHHVYYTNNPKKWDLIVEKEFPEKYKFVEEHQSDIWDKDIEKVLYELTDDFERHDLSLENERA